MEALIYVVVLIALVVGLYLLYKRLFPTFEWRLLLVTVPVILSIWITAVAYKNSNDPTSEGKRFTLGVDLAGGSILVYEVDPVFWEGQSPAFKQTFNADQLASRIKTRVDPSNLLETTIRPIHGDENRPPRVEIVLPISNDPKNKNSAGKIQDIKRLIQQQGQLEFRILAHNSSLPEFNDKDAISAAKTQLVGKIDDLLQPGKPLSSPEGYKGEYEWVELAPSEINTLKLNAQTPEGFHMNGDYAYFSAPSQRTSGIEENATNLGRHFVLTRKSLPEANVTGDNLEPASIYPDTQNLQNVVHFNIKSDAQDRFFNLTKEVQKQMAIIFDGKVISAPNLESRLSTGGIITMGSGKESHDRSIDLSHILQAGSLPAALRPRTMSVKMTMGPGLGEDTIRKEYLGCRRRVPRSRPIHALLLPLCRHGCCHRPVCETCCSPLLSSSLPMLLSHLPGLAGLVLMLGMAVDANVLIYERLREERERGANLAMAIRNAYDRAFPTIIDTHLTSIFTAVVLYVVGTDQLKGFGVSLTMGLVISLFTSLYMTRLIFDIALSRNWIKSLSMSKLFSKPNIDFMRVRYYWFTATIILSILGLALFLMRGEAGLNIDFTGGTAYTFQFKEPKTTSEVRTAVLNQKGLSEPAVDALYRDATVGNRTYEEFTLRTTNKDAIDVRNAVEKIFGQSLLYVETKANAFITTVPADKQDKDKHDKSFELTFTNKQPPAEEVTKFVEQWFKQIPGNNKENYEVKGTKPGIRPGSFESVAVYFKLPLDKQNEGPNLVKYLVEQFNLPVSDRLENFDSQLASETQGKAITAILLSWLAIVGYLWFRFGNWTFGVAAVLCLVHDLMFTVGLIALCHYIVSLFGNVLLLEDFKLDLPAVAALLTLVGYSVNDTIVVFDRIRETRGKHPELTPAMINDSVNGTLSRTILTSLVTWLVVLVLYIFGGEGVSSFLPS